MRVGEWTAVAGWVKRMRAMRLTATTWTVVYLAALAGVAGAVALVGAEAIGRPRVVRAAPPVLVEQRCDAALAWRTQLTLTDINLAWRAGEGDQREARPVLQRYLFQAQSEITRYCGE